MKKIKYLIIFILLFLVKNVSAKTMYDGLLYEVGWQNSNVFVYAKDTTYNAMDYNGWMIKSNKDDRIYYCIEPELYMQNTSDAIYGTHYTVSGRDNILSSSRLNDETLEKVKLYAYYGYNYNTKKIDHSSSKWYGIAQVLIWKTLRPDINYVMKTDRYGTLDDSLYISEINELENLVQNHNILPSFINEFINLSVGEEIELIDTNNVLKYYDISDSSNYSYKIDGNKLIIKALKEGSVQINFTKPDVLADFVLLKGNSLQDLITRGDIEKNSGKINLNITYKKVKIIKKDSSNDLPISDVKFSLYDENKNFLGEYKTDSNGEILLPNLTLGKYYLKEEETPIYYKLNEEIISFDLTKEDDDIKEIVIYNEKNKGSLKIIKVDKNTKIPISDTEIEIYCSLTNKLIYKGKTNEEGIIYLSLLEAGKYYIKETKASNGYIKDDTLVFFEIVNDEEEITVTLENEHIEIPNTYSKESVEIYFVIYFTLFILFYLIKKYYDKKDI